MEFCFDCTQIPKIPQMRPSLLLHEARLPLKSQHRASRWCKVMTRPSLLCFFLMKSIENAFKIANLLLITTKSKGQSCVRHPPSQGALFTEGVRWEKRRQHLIIDHFQKGLRANFINFLIWAIPQNGGYRRERRIRPVSKKVWRRKNLNVHQFSHLSHSIKRGL